MEHEFTAKIFAILRKHFGNSAETLFQNSSLLQYVNIKTKSAERGAKSRAAFANHYAIYVLLKDYVDGGFLEHDKNYAKYEGAKFAELLKQMRMLPFGQKLQNHALNNRLNHEFRKYFIDSPVPITHVPETQRYWINENLLIVSVGKRRINLAPALLEIIDAYIEAKLGSFIAFRTTCQRMGEVSRSRPEEIQGFIQSLLQPNVDARIFEIVSYAILKQHYSGIPIYWGYSTRNLKKEQLALFKTGRTNANDDGIDFVMKPLGRFFQVTETTDFKKYFLDIDKVQRYPITFVIKTTESVDVIRQKIKNHAVKEYSVETIVERYMTSIEEIINIPILLEYLIEAIKKSREIAIFDEIILQSEIEFNLSTNN